MCIYSLYRKRHKKTGLLYLGYTSQNPFSYPGSGIYWSDHLAEHGDDVETEILLQTTDHSEIAELGLHYSVLWDVVGARDQNGKKIWANLKLETGQGGAMSPESLAKAMSHPRPYDIRVSCLVCRSEVGFPNFVRSHGDKCGTLVGSSTGEDNSRYDQTSRTFHNHDTGEVFVGTRYELYSGRGLNKNGIGNIINKPGDVSQGWSLVPRVFYEFSHDDHGEVIMTKRQFADAYSLRYNLVGKLIEGRSEHYKGWRVRRTHVPERTDTSLHSSAP